MNPNAPPEEAPSRRQRLVILGICCLSLLIVGLDSTIVNVALPSIRNDLHASVSGLQWVIDAYTLVLASLLMLSGSTADRIGRKRVFQTGLVVFSLGSLLCGVAPTLELLVAFRVLQAIGGSMLNPVAMSIIRNVFDDPRERAMAIGMWGAVFGLSMALGPVLGGALVDSVGWRSVFFVNVPIGAVAFVLTAALVPESRAEHPRRLDPVGQLLVIAALASLTYAIIEAPRAGWTSPGILALFAFSLASFVALVLYELRRREPLVEMRFFRSAPFSGASTIAVCAFAALGGFLFLNTLYLQGVRHLSPFHAGLYLLPMAVMVLVCAPLSGRIVGRRGARIPLVIASCAMHRLLADADAADAHHCSRLPARRLLPVRNRLGDDQPADHEHRGVRDAGLAGGRRRRDRLHQPVGRPDPGRGGDRRDRRRDAVGRDRAELRRRDPRGLVGDRRARRDQPGRGPADHHRVGARHRPPHRRALPREHRPRPVRPARARSRINLSRTRG